MKKRQKVLFWITIFLLLIFPAGFVAIGAAQAKESAPGDLLYPVDLTLEEIELLLANDEKDVELYTQQLEERIEEMKKVLEEGDSEEIEDAMHNAKELYEVKLEALNELLESICEEDNSECDDKLVEKVTTVGESTLKHIAVLSEVYNKLVEKGNETAAESVLMAMEKSLNGHEKALEAVLKDKKSDGDGELELNEQQLELMNKFKDKKEEAQEKINLAKERGKGQGQNK